MIVNGSSAHSGQVWSPDAKALQSRKARCKLTSLRRQPREELCTLRRPHEIMSKTQS